MVVEDTKQPKAALWTIALALTTVILTYWRAENKLDSSRPHFEGEKEPMVLGSQRYLARLWQDPFFDVGSNIDGIIPAPILQAAIGAEGPARLSILAVMLAGYPYPEDVEVRLRTRYAVETALFDEGFTLVDGSHLGIATLAWPTTEGLKHLKMSSETPRLRIPFEWAEQSPTNKLLVLWLREEAFADYPLTRLALVMKALGDHAATDPPIPFRVVGPRASDTLRAMLSDPALKNNWTNGWIPDAHDILKRRLTVFSPEATAPDPLLGLRGEAQAAYKPRQWMTREFNTNLGSNCFHNFILTDDFTASRLVEELELRHVDVTHPAKSCVVLLSEADTSYGRALPCCFAAGIKVKQGLFTNLADALIDLEKNTNHWPTNVVLCSYLRGLDGTRAKQNGETTNSTPEAQSPGEATSSHIIHDPDQYELAQGESQLDYARRLAEYLDSRFKEEAHPFRWRLAIGVLGSDTYDKMILLEALRNKFRDALFFATDLDAQYNLPQEKDFTHNLLIASADNLEPPVVNRHSHAPFRDLYQTTVFKATVSALQGGSSELPHSAQMFEMGRRQIIKLDEPPNVWNWWSPPRLWGAALALVGLLVCSTLAPPAARIVRNAAILLFGEKGRAINAMQNERYLDLSDNAFHEAMECFHLKEDLWLLRVAIVGLISFLILIVVSYCNNCNGGEPFYWTEGVSIWPTELVRWAAILFGIGGMIHARYVYRRARLRLEHFFLRKHSSHGPPLLLPEQIQEATALAKDIASQADPMAEFLYESFDGADRAKLTCASLCRNEMKALLLRNLNRIIANLAVYDPERVRLKPLSEETDRLLKLKPQGELLIRVNRLILEDWYKERIAKRDPPKPLSLPPSPSFAFAWPEIISNASINFWPRILDYVVAKDLACEYFSRIEPLNRALRLTVSAGSFLVLSLGMFCLWGFPVAPGRGGLSFKTDEFILFVSVAVFIGLAFLIIDVSRLFSELLARLGDGVTVWPQHVIDKVALDRHVDPAHLSGYVDVSFVAVLSQQVGRVYYFPFIMLTLMLLARNEVFAPWTWPLALLLTTLSSAVMVFVFTFHVRRSAARVRNQAIDLLGQIETRTKGDEAEKYEWTVVFEDGTKRVCSATNYAEKIRGLIEELKAVKSGAYSKILQDDSVIAALIPTFGAVLLQVFPKLFF